MVLQVDFSEGTTPTHVADDAVGVSEIEKKQWFVMVVNNRSERKSADVLANLGYKVFVPIQKLKRTWSNGRKRIVEHVLMPAKVFVYCCESQRKSVLNLPFVNRCMVDVTKRDVYGNHALAVIPVEQMQAFMFVVQNASEQIAIGSKPIHLGDRVRVTSGNLMGLEGNVETVQNGVNLVISLGVLGCAKLNIGIDSVEKV